MIAQARETLAVFDVDIARRRTMGSLPVGLRQIVEIVKAARTRRHRSSCSTSPPRPSPSARSRASTTIVRRLREHGVAMVYTTHKMAEIRAIADRVVVLRDGGLILDEPLDRRSPTTTSSPR